MKTKEKKRVAHPERLVFFSALFVIMIASVIMIVSGEKKAETPDKTSTVAATADDGYSISIMSEDAVSEGDLVLVNNDHSFDSSSVKDLVSVYDNKTDTYYTADTNVSVRSEIMDSLNDMMDGF